MVSRMHVQAELVSKYLFSLFASKHIKVIKNYKSKDNYVKKCSTSLAEFQLIGDVVTKYWRLSKEGLKCFRFGVDDTHIYNLLKINKKIFI